MVDQVKKSIGEYVEHLSDQDYIRSIFSSFGVARVVATLETMFQSADPEPVRDVDLFVRDAISHFSLKERQPFVRAFSKSKLPSLYCEKLFGPDHFFRDMAIHTMSVVDLDPKGDYFKKAFERFKVEDPLLVPRLLQGISTATWKKNPNAIYELLDQLVISESYLTRWPTLGFIQPHSFFEIQRGITGKWRKKQRIAEKLVDDPNQFIRNEAVWVLEHFKLFPKMKSAENLKKKRGMTKQLNALEPKLTFDMVSQRFANDMIFRGKVSYTIDELNRFATAFEPFLEGDRLLLRDTIHYYLREQKEYGKERAKEFLVGFLKNDQKLERFKREFKKLLHPYSKPLAERAGLFSGNHFNSDAEASAFLQQVWLEAVGKPWK